MAGQLPSSSGVAEPAIAGVAGPLPGSLGPSRGRLRRGVLRDLLRTPGFVIGGAILLFWIVCALGGASLAPQDPFKVDYAALGQAPSGAHLFGTDQLGRDVFSRVIAGARDILVTAPLGTLLGSALGTAFGLLLGFVGGIVDDIGSRIIDALLSLPLIVVALTALVAVGPSQRTVILVIGFVFLPSVARTVRTAVMEQRNLEYVAAARLRTERAPWIMLREILPNVTGPVLVETTVRLGYAIFFVATLSFLGFGLQPPSPDWGLQVAENYGVISGGIWWPTVFPALAIASLIVAINLVAIAVEEAISR